MQIETEQSPIQSALDLERCESQRLRSFKDVPMVNTLRDAYHSISNLRTTNLFNGVLFISTNSSTSPILSLLSILSSLQKTIGNRTVQKMFEVHFHHTSSRWNRYLCGIFIYFWHSTSRSATAFYCRTSKSRVLPVIKLIMTGKNWRT